MEKKLLLLCILLMNFSVFAQSYKPLLDELNEWHFTTCFSGCFTDVYYTDGDTIVDGKNYKILDGFHYISRTFLLREEVENKKVFLNLVFPDYNEEYLLYDFSLSQGDIFDMKNPISPFPRDGGPFILDSIVNRPLQDGNDYRHFYFSPAPGNTISTENAVWIEGVGSLSIINAPGGHPNINAVGNVSCYFKNTEVFYANLDSIEDCIPVHLGLKNNILENVILSKQNNTNVCLLSNAQNVRSATIYNLQGKKLREFTNNGDSKMRLDLSSYQTGMYLIIARGIGDSKKSFKIVK